MMDDDQLAEFLGIAKAKRRAEILAALTPAERAEHEEMKAQVDAIMLWDKGLGPLPPGVIVCNRRRR